MTQPSIALWRASADPVRIEVLPLQKLAIWAVVALVTLLAPPSLAADLESPPSADDFVLREQLEPRALLYLIRRAFDVLDTQDVADSLEKDASALRDGQSPPEADEALRKALIAEGSYYITSLRYLIAIGGANWPQDLPAPNYDARYNARLGTLQESWISAAQNLASADMRAILIEVDKINALTEGNLDMPAELDHFADLDALVASAAEAPADGDTLHL